MANEERVNILMVDDRPENLIALESILTHPGLNLIRASSGPDALRAVLQHEFAVILLDVNMPGMDGFETADMIRKRPRSEHTPIIFLTAIEKGDQEVFKGYSIGAVDYIFKPFVPEILKSKVAVFVDLFNMREQVKQHAAQLQALYTELKTKAEQLEAANLQLAALNRELESFSYSVSHDLRAPLRHIEGFAKILLERYAIKLDDEAKRFIDRICSGAKNMNDLIDDLLKLSRVTRAEMSVTETNLSDIARSITAGLKEGQPERQVEFVIADGVLANSDGRMMRIVLQNLLDNAFKYTGKHEKARIEFGVDHSQSPAVYFVKDDGAGFNMAYSNKLFGVFQRLHSPKEFQGIGIGLATVLRIILRHGGRIWAEGVVEKGATFFFTLP